MNWFTRAYVEARSLESKQTMLEEDGSCEHVEKDISLAYAMRRENDSFGPVSSFLCCKACDDKAIEDEGNEECVCVDCKETVKNKDGINWKWYDFLASQGDTPLFVCNTCRALPTHRTRVAKDEADYEDEFGPDGY